MSMVFHKWLHKLDKNKEELYAVVRTEKASLMWVIFQLPSYKNRAIQLKERTEAATAAACRHFGWLAFALLFMVNYML